MQEIPPCYDQDKAAQLFGNVVVEGMGSDSSGREEVLVAAP